MIDDDEMFADKFDPQETDRKYGDTQAVPPKFPVFCTVILIVDIFLCLARMLFVGLGVVGYAALQQQGGALATTAAFEIASGTGIVVFGLSADLLLLLRQKWALVLAGLAVLATLSSTCVGIWQLTIMYPTMAGGGPAQQMGLVIGGGITLIVRIAIIVTYAAALWMFGKWVGHTRDWIAAQ